MSEPISKLASLPDFLSSNDLVDLGLFSSPDSVYFARMKGNSPDFIKLGRRVIYPKASVIQFLERHTKKGNESQSGLNNHQQG